MYIGIDIGGTNTRVAAVDANCKITHLIKQNTSESVTTANDFLNRLILMIENIPNYRNCKAIGIGVPGMIVDNKITTCRNFKALVNFPLAEHLVQHFGKPVYLQNDAKVAAFAEALAGAGRNCKTVAFVGLGTGLGGGVVINKELYLGSSNLGGYFSRIILDGKEIAENLITGIALRHQSKELLGKDLTATQLFELAATKNETALGLLQKFQTNLTNLLLNISVTINPEVIVLGGGIMESSAHFLGPVVNAFRACAHANAQGTQIVPASLKYPGVTGAALYAAGLFLNQE